MRSANVHNPKPASRPASRGAAAVEFALVMPILIMLLFGIIEFGRAYNAKLTLANAAREAAREFVITGDEALVEALLVDLQTSLSDVTLTVDDLCHLDPPHVLATAETAYSFNLPLVTSGTMDLSETVVMRCGN